jgi:hypothetical protein
VVERQLACVGRPRRRPAVEAVLEDRNDAAVGARVELEAAPARGFEPAGAVLSREAQDAQAGPEPLLRMRPALEDDRRQLGCVRTDRGGVTPDAIDRPAGVAPMGARHMLRQPSWPLSGGNSTYPGVQIFKAGSQAFDAGIGSALQCSHAVSVKARRGKALEA